MYLQGAGVQQQATPGEQAVGRQLQGRRAAQGPGLHGEVHHRLPQVHLAAVLRHTTHQHPGAGHRVSAGWTGRTGHLGGAGRCRPAPGQAGMVQRADWDRGPSRKAGHSASLASRLRGDWLLMIRGLGGLGPGRGAGVGQGSAPKYEWMLGPYARLWEPWDRAAGRSPEVQGRPGGPCSHACRTRPGGATETHTGASPEEVSGPRQVRGDQQEVVYQAQKHPGHGETPRRGQTLNTLPCTRMQCPPGGGRTVQGLTSEFSQTQIKGPSPEKPTTDQSPWDSAPAGAGRAQQLGWELTGSVLARRPGQAASHAHSLLEAC